MAKTFKFDASLVSLFARVRDEGVAQVCQGIAGGIATVAEEKTPVKTGNAKGSWQIGVGGPDLATGIGSNSANAQKVRQIRGDLPIFVTNNVAYAGRLEKGYSKKAPNGMLILAIQAVQGQIAQIINQARERT